MTSEEAYYIIDQATQPSFNGNRQEYVLVNEALKIIAERLKLYKEFESRQTTQEKS